MGGVATGELSHLMENNGLGGLPGPAGDLACPRNIILSCLVTDVLELLIATASWFSKCVPQAAAASSGKLLSQAPPSPTKSDTLEVGPSHLRPNNPSRGWCCRLAFEDHCAGPSWLT